MFEKSVTITNTVGLHARAAAYFVQRASEFKSTILIQKNERTANAKSLLGVLSLGIMPGAEVTLTADGKDEKTAINVLYDLIISDFSE
jgi:phosphocarrier protein